VAEDPITIDRNELLNPIFQGNLDGKGLRIAIVVSRFSGEPCQQLLDGALERLQELGIKEQDIDVASVPGAFEIPGTVKVFLRQKVHDAIITLGCVIRGETPHFDYIAGTCATSIAKLASKGKTPVIFGVLTTDDRDQAMARCGGDRGNKGRDSADTAVEMANLYRAVSETSVETKKEN